MADELWIRCPRLGGEVPFSYCLKEMGTLPCARTITCWQPYFPVQKYLGEKLTAQEWQQCFGGSPKGKMASLIELIDEAKKSVDGQ